MNSERHQSFEEKHFSSAFETFAKKTMKNYYENEEVIVGHIKKQLSDYVQMIAKSQQIAYIPKIAYIHLSFLYTSYHVGEAKFQIDAYSIQGIGLEDSLYTGYFKDEVITTYIEELKEDLLNRSSELRRFLAPAYIDTLILRALRSMLRYFLTIIKYKCEEIIDLEAFKLLEKETDFFLCYGEYYDWQKPIFGMREEIDLFNYDWHESTNFRKFLGIYYEDKIFEELNLSHSVFKDCTFLNCKIKETIWNDCVFENCIFQDSQIIESYFLGVTFIKCKCKDLKFDKTIFDWMPDSKNKKTDFYKVVELDECEIVRCNFQDCMLETVVLEDCMIEAVEKNLSLVEQEEQQEQQVE